MATLMEELNSGLGVVLGVVAVLGYGIALVWGWASMVFRGKAAEVAIKEEKADRLVENAELRKKHADHYGTIGAIQTQVATIAQALTLHVSDDERQLGEIKASILAGREELRDDMKGMRGEILTAIAELRKSQ